MATRRCGPTIASRAASGADFHPWLDLTKAELILRKGFRPGIDSYSSFFENDRKTPTGLAGYLGECGINTVTLVGLATDYCVAYSALDAARLRLQDDSAPRLLPRHRPGRIAASACWARCAMPA